MTPEDVAAAGAPGNRYPPDAQTVATDDFLLVRWPDWFRAAPTVVRLDAEAPVDEVLDEAAAHARGWEADDLLVWVGLDPPTGLEAALRARGGRLDETVDVFAVDLAAGVPELAVPDDVEVRWQVDADTTRASIEVSRAAFGQGEMPSADQVDALAAEALAELEADRAACAVGYLEGRPAGTGGLTLVDGVARLWGGGVAPDARRRGVYRAVLDRRLRHAHSLGARLALVKGVVSTSGPILRRAGFEVFGQERSYLVPIGGSALTGTP